MEAVWKPVKGYEDSYEVSNLGQVRSIAKEGLDKGGRPHRTPSVMLKLDKDGRALLYRDGKYKNMPVRSLVGEAFLDIPFGEDITHLDGDIENSKTDNLMTTKEFRNYDDDWRDIPGYEGIYQASRYGQIRSLDRYVQYRGGLRFLHGVVRELDDAEGGYYQIALYRDNKHVTKHVHIFVAQAWIPNPENKPTVNHLDGDKHNNNIENLEWATHSEQQAHAVKTGLRKKSYWTPEQGTVGGDWNKSRQIRVRCIETGTEYESYSAAGDAIGQSASEVKRSAETHAVCKGLHFVKADEPDYEFGIQDEEGEIWKDIPGWEGLYQASNKHRVKSVQRKTTYYGGRVRTVPERIMTKADKYTLHRDGKSQNLFAKDIFNATFPKKNKLFNIS